MLGIVHSFLRIVLDTIQDYTNVISKYTRITFSRFTLQLTFGNKFNQPLGNSLDKLEKLEQLTFGKHFNQSLGNSLDNLINLRQLTFGNKFNQP